MLDRIEIPEKWFMEEPTEAPDGVRRTFTTQDGREYISGKIKVFVAGSLQTPGLRFTEINNTTIQMTFDIEEDEKIILSYASY